MLFRTKNNGGDLGDVKKKSYQKDAQNTTCLVQRATFLGEIFVDSTLGEIFWENGGHLDVPGPGS